MKHIELFSNKLRSLLSNARSQQFMTERSENCISHACTTRNSTAKNSLQPSRRLTHTLQQSPSLLKKLCRSTSIDLCSLQLDCFQHRRHFNNRNLSCHIQQRFNSLLVQFYYVFDSVECLKSVDMYAKSSAGRKELPSNVTPPITTPSLRLSVEL